MYTEFLRKNPREIPHFMRGMPSYVLNEIGPIWQLRNYQTDNDLVLFDVGANHGYWAGAYLSVAGSKTARVEMFEPLPGNIRWVRTNLERGFYGEDTAKITLNEYGISDRDSATTLNFDTEHSGYASMSSDVSRLPMRNVQLGNTMEVPVRSIDSVCQEKGISHIDILKIDIEGFELFALAGAEKMFARQAIGNCLFEFGPHQLSNRQIFRDFYDFFTGFGYRLYKYRDGGQKLIPIKEYLTSFEMYDKVSMFIAEVDPERDDATASLASDETGRASFLKRLLGK